MKLSESMIRLGTTIEPWGKVVAVGWVGELYYWLIDSHGVVSMMPSYVVESHDLRNRKPLKNHTSKKNCSM